MFEDHCDGPVLDADAWIASDLPMWSSRAASAAACAVEDEPEREGPEDHVPLLAVDTIRWTP